MDGLVHLYYGDGKGKTSSAMGIAVRAAGWDKKVCIFQFLKNQLSGEEISFKRFNNITVIKSLSDNNKFFWEMTDEQKKELKDRVLDLYLKLEKEIQENKYNVIICDEILGAIENGLISENKLCNSLKNKPKNLELIITGRRASNKLIDLCDYVSEIKCIKHPFNRGIKARKGIEY